jgi:hypothetical protein
MFDRKIAVAGVPTSAKVLPIFFHMILALRDERPIPTERPLWYCLFATTKQFENKEVKDET